MYPALLLITMWLFPITIQNSSSIYIYAIWNEVISGYYTSHDSEYDPSINWSCVYMFNVYMFLFLFDKHILG